jgi:hypothetical protein
VDVGLSPPDDLVFAASNSDLGAASMDDAGQPLYRDIGFDLDDTCTREGQAPPCVEPSWASAPHTDGVDGIDNAAGQSWWQAGFGPVTFSAANPVPIVRVGGYSGKPDDPQVAVSLYVGLGLEPRADGADGGTFGDGQDRWKILPQMLRPSADGGTPSVDEPLFRDDQAYVSGGKLVAHFPEALWTLGAPLAPAALARVYRLVVAGSLTRVSQTTWELQNLVVGFAVKPSDDFIFGAYLPFGTTNAPLCQFASDFRAAEKRVCTFADIASTSDSASAPCDALSAGFRLQAKQAGFGEVLTQTPVPPPCAPGVHPEIDSCDSLADE